MNQSTESQMTGISVEELKELLDTGRAPFLLDVRDASELNEELGHLPGIRNLPIKTLRGRVSELDEVRGEEIVTICGHNERADAAARMLVQAGFSKVRFLDGGMTRWVELGLPVERAISA